MTITEIAPCEEDPGRSAASPWTPTGTSGPARAAGGRRPGLGTPFWRVWSATAVSSVGDGLALVAFPLLAASLTSSPVLIAGVLFAQRLPWLLLGLHAGALADRLPRFRLMASVDAIRAGVVLVLAASTAAGAGHLAAVYAAAFLLGACDTAFSGAAHAVLPEVVDEADLERANGYLMAAQTGGEQVAGPAAGGLVFAAAAALPFAVDGVTFAVSAALVAALARRMPADAPGVRERHSLGRDVREGLRYFASMPSLRLLAGLVAGMALAQSMVMGVLVVYALHDLGLTGAGYGVLLAAAAVGNVLGSLLAARLRARLGAAALLSGAGALAAGAYLVMAATSSPVVAAAGLFVECVAVACGSVATAALRQRAVPVELLGRVGNAFRVAIWGAIPVGALAGGIVAGAAGARTTFVAAGVAQLVLVVATRLPLRERLGAVLDLREPARSPLAA